MLRDNARRRGRGSHPDQGRAVISLTSYPTRFGHLHHVLESLLAQSVEVEIVLYLDSGNEAVLPRRVHALCRRGLRVAPCPPFRSYCKLIPALADYPRHHIITVDDDVIYPADLVESLLQGLAHGGVIPARRVHRLSRAIDGNLLPYGSWPQDVQDAYARRPSIDLLPTGVGGVLYPAGSLPPMAMDMGRAMAMAPRHDDLWFYWMARLAGTRHVKVGGVNRLLHTPGSQDGGLWQNNRHGDNDAALSRLLAAFGMPPGFAEPVAPALPLVDTTA